MYDYVRMYNTKEKLEETINDWRLDLYVKLQNEGFDIEEIKDIEVHLVLNQDKFKTNIQKDEEKKNKLD